MTMVGKRNPFMCRYSVGFDDNALLTAVKLDYISDCGWMPNDAVGTMSMAMTICDNAYYCPNWLVTPFLVKTNLPTNTACRAPGVCPAVFFIETIMDDVARSLKATPDSVRGANLYKKDQVTPYLQPLPYCSLDSLWKDAYSSMDYLARKAAADQFNSANRWRKRGISIAPQKYGLGWNSENLSAYVTVYGHDGSVVVSHAGVESGQGINTKVAQVVAYTLGVPLSKVTVELPTQFTLPNAACTGGSVTSELCCMAAQAACNNLKVRLDAVRQTLPPTATWMDLINKCVQQLVDLSARVRAGDKTNSTCTTCVY
jgi:xanthine dehydrogenase/oxidase